MLNFLHTWQCDAMSPPLPRIQNQALNALVFLYREVLDRPLSENIRGIVRAKRPKRLPVVLTVKEVSAILSQLRGTQWLIACLQYGSGLRLIESVRLRVMDIDFRCQHHSESGDHSSTPSRNKQKSQLPYTASFICHPSSGKGDGYTHGAGATGAQGCSDNPDLYPCAQPWRFGGAQSVIRGSHARCFLRCISSNEVAAGVTPGMRPACPRVCGRWRMSFSRTSDESPLTCS